ncbi:LuxR C-terminal-related transcriptional regulator [Actinomadura chibensis]|uniref:LuxR C-terminal-related transcriptional regulator n=1 Tax=Actinomadura chibensis TaxID=392828 RepID=UPI001C3F41BB
MRETDIARRVASGKTNVEIAAGLHLASATVKDHLAAIQRPQPCGHRYLGLGRRPSHSRALTGTPHSAASYGPTSRRPCCRPPSSPSSRPAASAPSGPLAVCEKVLPYACRLEEVVA